jgi:hypothetical protein
MYEKVAEHAKGCLVCKMPFYLIYGILLMRKKTSITSHLDSSPHTIDHGPSQNLEKMGPLTQNNGNCALVELKFHINERNPFFSRLTITLLLMSMKAWNRLLLRDNPQLVFGEIAYRIKASEHKAAMVTVDDDVIDRTPHIDSTWILP